MSEGSPLEITARAREANSGCRIWWRDDDAAYIPLFHLRSRMRARRRLEGMLEILGKFSTPSFFSVVPTNFLEKARPLARLLHEYGAHIALHGLRHANRAPQGQPNEFPDGLWGKYDLNELLEYREKFSAEFGAKFLPILTPPFNAICDDFAALLKKEGFTISAYNPPGSRPLRHNADYDLIDWGRRQMKPRAEIADGIAALLLSGRQSLGILGHHKFFDEGDRRFLGAMLKILLGESASKRMIAPVF